MFTLSPEQLKQQHLDAQKQKQLYHTTPSTDREICYFKELDLNDEEKDVKEIALNFLRSHPKTCIETVKKHLCDKKAKCFEETRKERLMRNPWVYLGAGIGLVLIASFILKK